MKFSKIGLLAGMSALISEARETNLKVQFGDFVTDARGKSGGTVYSRNGSGAYKRTKVAPIQPNTTAQQNQKASFTDISQAWRGLTQSERADWNRAVDNWVTTNIFGGARKLSGFLLFKKLNGSLAAVGVAQINTPPLAVPLTTVDNLSVNAAHGAGTVQLAWSGAISADEVMIMRATAPVSAGKNFVKSEFRQIGLLTFAEVTPQVITGDYVGVFGASLPEGAKIFVEVITVNIVTGQRAVAMQCSCIIAA